MKLKMKNPNKMNHYKTFQMKQITWLFKMILPIIKDQREEILRDTEHSKTEQNYTLQRDTMIMLQVP